MHRDESAGGARTMLGRARSFWPGLARLFGLGPPAPPGVARVPDGLRVFAVGDIHGHADLLDRLLRVIEDDLARAKPGEALLVFLGDFVDRGPDSAGVLERLAAGRLPAPAVFLRGNHEDVMMRALADVDAFDHWCEMGGVATLRSYGVKPPTGGRKARVRAQVAMRTALPAAHLRFLEATRLSHIVGDYFFVHAGARPGVPLDRQTPEDLLWIRGEFDRSDHDFGKTVVHGHTPCRVPIDVPRRINVDTGAFKWGTLTCVALQGTERRFLSTRG